MPKIKFGEFLVNENKIDIAQLKEALQRQVDLQFAEHYKMLGEILTQDMHVLDDDEMPALLEHFYEDDE